MKAMVLDRLHDLRQESLPLELRELPDPQPGRGEILIRVRACGVCHTELDIIEGRTPPPVLPLIPGHQVVGIVEKRGLDASRFEAGERVGVAWIFAACGACDLCRAGKENLCQGFRATGRDAPGGYAECMTVDQDFAYRIPPIFSDAQAAPLLCAGAIGYRSLRLTGMRNGDALGLTGFGASAHLVLKMVRYQYPDSPVFVFARSQKERTFALELGAVWAGDTAAACPQKLDCIIDTTPVWKPVVCGLGHLKSGGRLVINAIRKESADRDSLLALDYERDLWMEKEIKSVANVTRSDVGEFLELAARIPILPETEAFALKEANRALLELKAGRIRGAKVLQI
jgi:propanol-preferring alcohol dehydrogenase